MLYIGILYKQFTIYNTIPCLITYDRVGYSNSYNPTRIHRVPAYRNDLLVYNLQAYALLVQAAVSQLYRSPTLTMNKLEVYITLAKFTYQ